MNKELITKIAKLYYLEGLSYSNISLKLNISIAYISKLLKLARENKIVEIKINDDESTHEIDALREKIVNKFNLKDACIIKDPNSRDVDEIKKSVALGAATFLYENLNKKGKLGITWGTTISNVVQSMRNFKKRDVEIDCIQLLGNLTGMPLENNSINLVTKMSKIFSGKNYFLNVPAVLDNEYILQALKSSIEVKKVLKKYDEINFSIASVGCLSDLEYSSLYINNYLNDEIVEDFRKQKIVGDVLFNFFTMDGKIVKTIFNNRIMGISLEDYLKIPNKIIISAGSYKVPAILGAIKTGLVDILITNLKTATELLEISVI